MPKKELISIEPHPRKVLVKIPKALWNSIFSKYITIKGGGKQELFVDIEEEEGFERRFAQNISVGVVLAVGRDIKGVEKGDMAIMDYVCTGTDEGIVGRVGNDRVVAVDSITTYHQEDAMPQMNGRCAYFKGDFDMLSKLLGVVRVGNLIALHPYVFLKYEEPNILKVSESGVLHEDNDEMCIRTVLSSHPNCVAQAGQKVLVRESDLVERRVQGKRISVIFEQDIIMVTK